MHPERRTLAVTHPPFVVHPCRGDVLMAHGILHLFDGHTSLQRLGDERGPGSVWGDFLT